MLDKFQENTCERSLLHEVLAKPQPVGGDKLRGKVAYFHVEWLKGCRNVVLLWESANTVVG